jgi:alkanesulfonate monooxygenase SsuD/methylene tetrahydromethanopterin reductase-like flavin-dependent oxidoreductase (luciferase family)
MIRALGVAGTPDEARQQLADLQEGPIDHAIVTVPQQATDLALETIQALAPE